MRTIGIWNVTDDTPQRLQYGTVELESKLEDWIAQEPSLLQSGLAIIGRQVRVSSGYIDLLGIDLGGNWVIIELKRGNVRRETIAQALDYAGCLLDMSIDDIELAVSRYLSTSLREIIHELGVSVEAPNRQNIAVYVAGTGRDPNLERMAQFFSSDFQFNVVSFDVFEETNGLRYIVRELSELDLRPAQAPKSSAATTSVDALRGGAHAAGIGEQFDVLYQAGMRHEMYPRLYKSSVMFAPPTFKSRMGYTFWIKPTDSRMVCWISPTTFAEFYPIGEQRAYDVLGLDEDKRLLLDGTGAQALADRLDALFSLITAAQAE